MKTRKVSVPWNPWLAVAFVILIYYASQYIGGLFISIYPLLKHWTVPEATAWATNSIWAQFIYVLIVESLTLGALYLFLKSYRSGFKDIGWRSRPRLRDFVAGVAALPVYYVSYAVIVAVASALLPSLNVDQQQQIGFENVHAIGGLVITFVSLVILPPIVEEILVRGFLYTSLKKGLPQLGAALTTSAIFAMAHLQAGSGAPLLWVAAIDTFILSLFLIYLREKTGGLWASITLHALKNGVAFFYLFILSTS